MKFRRAHGPLERPAPQEGDLRMDRLRVVSFVIGGALGVKAPKDEQTYVGDSGKAHQLVDQHFPTENVESVIVKGPAALRARRAVAVDDTIAAVTGKPGVYEVESPFAKGNESQISKDGKSVLVNFKLRGDETQAEESVAAVLAAVAGVQAASVGVFWRSRGANKALSKAFEDDFKKAETLSLPITLIILVFAFGALVAAGVPLLLGLSAVMAALGLVALPSQIVPLGENTASIILLVGLAVGVDYTLFYLRREREERARGVGHREAIHIAAATSGRAVLISGVTVMVAMAGMFLAGDQTFTALGVGAITVVLVAMIGSVTVVPACCRCSATASRRAASRSSSACAAPTARAGSGTRCWTSSCARPAISAILATALLLVLAFPALGMRAVLSGTDDLPRNLPVMQVYDQIDAAFPGGQIPAIVTIAGNDVTTPRSRRRSRTSSARGGLRRLQRAGRRDRLQGQAGRPDRDPDQGQRHRRRLQRRPRRPARHARRADGRARRRRLAGLRGRHDGRDQGLRRLPQGPRAAGRRLRAGARVPAAAGHVPLDRDPDQGDRAQPAVGGRGLRRADLGLPGRPLREGARLQSNGGVTAWLPIFLFVILFGLSMDYHVFILSRVKEAVDRGMKTEDAVAHSIKATASTVTSAAIVMVAVFAIFATLTLHRLQADGHRPRGRDPHRRDDRAGGAAAGDDEAAGQVELVPAVVAALAAGVPPRSRARARRGLAPSTTPAATSAVPARSAGDGARPLRSASTATAAIGIRPTSRPARSAPRRWTAPNQSTNASAVVITAR